MTFTQPVALWLALAIPIVIFAFFIRRKLRRRSSTTLFLWEEALGKSFVKSRSFKLRDAMSLIVALLITLALILSALEPRFGSAERDAAIFVLDNSASMNAVETNGKTRFELARNALEKAIANKNEETEFLVLTTAGAPAIVSGFSRDSAALRKELGMVEPTGLASAANESLELARFFSETRGNGTPIVYLSDGCFESPERFMETLSASPKVRFEQIGKKLNNVAIKTFAARRSPLGDASYEVTIEVVNEGSAKASFDVEIGLNDVLVDLIPLALEPNERVLRTIKYESVEGGALSAAILFGSDRSNALNDFNRLLEDDIRAVELPAFPDLNVLIYGEYDRFLQLVFESQPKVHTNYIEKIPTTLDDDTLLVVVGAPPAELPKGKILFVSPSSDCEFFSVEGEPVDTVVEPGVVESAATSFLDWRNVSLRGVRVLEPVEGVEFEVLARTPESPAIFALHDTELPESKRWVFNFSCKEDAIVLRTFFPILFANLVGVMRGTDVEAANIETAQDEAEHDLRTVVVSEKIGENTNAENALGGTALWKYFAVLALILATLEFYWYCRRRV